jgi:hypothetical protein
MKFGSWTYDGNQVRNKPENNKQNQKKILKISKKGLKKIIT